MQVEDIRRVTQAGLELLMIRVYSSALKYTSISRSDRFRMQVVLCRTRINSLYLSSNHGHSFMRH